MTAIILAFLASCSLGATAGLYHLAIWWRFVASVALTVALFAATWLEIVRHAGL